MKIALRVLVGSLVLAVAMFYHYNRTREGGEAGCGPSRNCSGCQPYVKVTRQRRGESRLNEDEVTGLARVTSIRKTMPQCAYYSQDGGKTCSPVIIKRGVPIARDFPRAMIGWEAEINNCDGSYRGIECDGPKHQPRYLP